MGSYEIQRLGHKHAFAFIAIKGVKSSAHEKRSFNKKDLISVTQIFYTKNNEIIEDELEFENEDEVD